MELEFEEPHLNLKSQEESRRRVQGYINNEMKRGRFPSATGNLSHPRLIHAEGRRDRPHRDSEVVNPRS